MWLMLAEGATEPELVDRLTQEFDVDEQTAREDVASFLASCRENGAADDSGRRIALSTSSSRVCRPLPGLPR